MTDFSGLEARFLKNLEREKSKWTMPEELGDIEDRVRERLERMADGTSKLSAEFYAELEGDYVPIAMPGVKKAGSKSDLVVCTDGTLRDKDGNIVPTTDLQGNPVSPGNKAVDKILAADKCRACGGQQHESVREENLPTEQDVLEFGLSTEHVDPYRATLPVAVKPTRTYTWWQKLQCFFGRHKGKAIDLGLVFVFNLQKVYKEWPANDFGHTDGLRFYKANSFPKKGFRCDCCKMVVVPGVTKNAKYWLKAYSHLGEGLAKFMHATCLDTLEQYYAAKTRETELKVPKATAYSHEDYYWDLRPEDGQRYECNHFGQPIPRPLPKPGVPNRPPPTRIPGPGVPVSR